MCYTVYIRYSKSQKTGRGGRRKLRAAQKKEDIRMAVVKLTTATFDQEVLNADRPVLVDFYADWCGPCKMMGPVVEEVSGELSGVKVCKINIDENMEIAQRYGVMSIPTFIAFKNGEISGKQIGAVPKGALVDLVK